MLTTLPMPVEPYIYWLVGLRYPKPLISTSLQVLPGSWVLFNFAWGGRAEPNGPTAAERLLKLFIFFYKKSMLIFHHV